MHANVPTAELKSHFIGSIQIFGNIFPVLNFLGAAGYTLQLVVHPDNLPGWESTY